MARLSAAQAAAIINSNPEKYGAFKVVESDLYIKRHVGSAWGFWAPNGLYFPCSGRQLVKWCQVGNPPLW